MRVIVHLLGTAPETDKGLANALGRRRWTRLLQDLAAEPVVTLPPGWELMDGGRVEARAWDDDYEALMMPRGPRGGRLPR